MKKALNLSMEEETIKMAKLLSVESGLTVSQIFTYLLNCYIDNRSDFVLSGEEITLRNHVSNSVKLF